MKVGLLAANMSPAEGGGHTFVFDLLVALGRLRQQCQHELTLCHYQGGAALARSFPEFPNLNLEAERPSVLTQEERLREQHPPWRRRISNVVDRMFSSAPPTAPWQDRIYRREGVQFVIPMGPLLEGITVDIPFAMMVWDLQHRISPWFPEVSSGPEWRRREHGYAELLRRASIIYVGTGQGRDEIVSYYQVPAERIKVLPFATPTFAREAATEPRKPDLVSRLGIPADYIFYPAQFWPHKNHVLALEACKIVRDRTGWDLGVVFTGADKGNLSYVGDYARRLGLEKSARFLGFVDRANLVELYRGAFCLAFPTLFGPDNLPPLEAFGLGCPVVASDVPGAREQLGDAAILFPPTNEYALADAILSLRDAAARQRLVEAGRKVATSSSWEDYAKGIIESLDDFAALRRTWP